MAANYGYDTFLISDATATFNKVRIKEETYNSELMHQTALASLKDEFAIIISSKEFFVIFQSYLIKG